MSTPTLLADVAGIGVLGPGLTNWSQGQVRLLLTAGEPPVATLVSAPALLSATERRRAGLLIKASVDVAEQACVMAGIDPAQVATVFTSSTSDPSICHALCEALASAERLISPTRFTNSVHNAAAGYWHIATHSQQASTSLAAFDASAGAGLLEAMAQCAWTQRPILLVACDLPYPEPLHHLRPIADVFAFALLLVPPGAPALAHISLQVVGDEAHTSCGDPGWEALRLAVPAARALPLLQTLAAGGAAGPARGGTSTLVLEGQTGLSLRIQVTGPSAAP